MKKNIYKILLIFLMLNATSFGLDTVKITIVERITQFVQWPNLEKEFHIGIYKNEALKNEMEKVFNKKKIHKLPIKVYNIEDPDDIRVNLLNLIYFTKESSKDVDKLFKKIQYKPVLIITEHPNDVYSGMHLGLYYKNKKIKFIINQESLVNSKLKASYKILKLAKIVKKETTNE